MAARSLTVPGLALLLTLAGVASCSDSRSEVGSSRAGDSQATASPKQPPAPAPSLPSIREADARALLDTWLAAQNAGDFARYEALYAERFAGVKRVGLRSERFDREGWLRDRKRMFARPMRVEASEVHISTTAATASVRFVQRWSSATFQDRGAKELRLIPTAQGLRISSEELLASEVERAGRAAELAASDLRPVVHTRTSYVVLSRAGDERMAQGGPLLDSEVGSTVAVRKLVRLEALPEGAQAALGMRVRLFDQKGEVCRAKLGEVSLLRRLTPHFGTVQMWQGSELLYGKPQAPVPLEQVAREAWEEAAATTLVVAALEDVAGKCDAALWAREDGRLEATVFAPAPLDPELEKSLVEEVRKLPAYRALAAEYEAYRKQLGNTEQPVDWERHDGEQPSYTAWQNGGRTFVAFAADVGGCSDFGGSLWALYEKRGDTLTLLNHPGSQDEPGALEPAALFDANLDGAPELLGRGWYDAPREADVLLRGTKDGLQFVYDLAPPFHDCGC